MSNPRGAVLNFTRHGVSIRPSLRLGGILPGESACRGTRIHESVQRKGRHRVEDRWPAGVLHRFRTTGSSTTVRLDHLSFGVTNYKESVSFYSNLRDGRGLTMTRAPQNEVMIGDFIRRRDIRGWQSRTIPSFGSIPPQPGGRRGPRLPQQMAQRWQWRRDAARPSDHIRSASRRGMWTGCGQNSRNAACRFRLIHPAHIRTRWQNGQRRHSPGRIPELSHHDTERDTCKSAG